MTIRLNLIKNVNHFVNIVSRYPYEMILRSGRQVRDAKSVLGIISLDLNNPLTLEIYHDNCDQLMEELSPFIEAGAS
jgi:phosphotransferase system HPr-like phosphotransfer protein